MWYRFVVILILGCFYLLHLGCETENNEFVLIDQIYSRNFNNAKSSIGRLITNRSISDVESVVYSELIEVLECGIVLNLEAFQSLEGKVQKNLKSLYYAILGFHYGSNRDFDKADYYFKFINDLHSSYLYLEYLLILRQDYKEAYEYSSKINVLKGNGAKVCKYLLYCQIADIHRLMYQYIDAYINVGKAKMTIDYPHLIKDEFLYYYRKNILAKLLLADYEFDLSNMIFQELYENIEKFPGFLTSQICANYSVLAQILDNYHLASILLDNNNSHPESDPAYFSYFQYRKAKFYQSQGNVKEAVRQMERIFYQLVDQDPRNPLLIQCVLDVLKIAMDHDDFGREKWALEYLIRDYFNVEKLEDIKKSHVIVSREYEIIPIIETLLDYVDGNVKHQYFLFEIMNDLIKRKFEEGEEISNLHFSSEYRSHNDKYIDFLVGQYKSEGSDEMLENISKAILLFRAINFRDERIKIQKKDRRIPLTLKEKILTQIDQTGDIYINELDFEFNDDANGSSEIEFEVDFSSDMGFDQTLMFYQSNDSLYIITESSGNSNLYTLSSSEICSSINKVKTMISSSELSDTQIYQNESFKVFAALFQEVFDDFNHDIIYVYDDGCLTGFPLGVLQININGIEKLLLEEFSLIHTLSGSISDQNGIKPFKVAACSFSSENTLINARQTKFSELVYSTQEVGSIKKILYEEEVELVHGEKFDKRKMKQLLNDKNLNVLHIASHIISDSRNLNTSMLVVRDELNGIDELSADFIEMNNNSLDLVFINGCSSHEGLFFANEGIYNLSRSFGLSGAKNTISTSWPIDDYVGMLLSDSFYKCMSSKEEFNDENISLCLTLSKKSIIQAGYRAPYYWSGYLHYSF